MLKRIRWFFGEFFVVTAGVLVAFGLNGWYQNIREQDKERKYLQEVHADLISTLDNVETAEKQQRKTAHSAAQLLKASYSTILPSDSTLAQYAFGSMSFAPATQLSAALSSLVSTGDLQLISNDSLRTALGWLVSRIEEYSRTNNEMGYTWLFQAYENFADVVHASDLRYQLLNDNVLAEASKDTLSGLPHPAMTEYPEPINLYELVREAAFRGSLLKLYVAQINLLRVHSGFLTDMESVISLLESEMEARNVPFEKREKESAEDSTNELKN